jgi:NIMA (never in mitosis gene a)-related kinase
MDFADGGDLLQNIKKRQGEQPQWFEEVEVWDYAIQMVKGLKSLHDRSILHRDLKSANIFLY